MSHIKITRLVFGLFMGVTLMSATAKAETRSGYEAKQRGDGETLTAGQTLRQPAAEKKWQERLLSLPAFQNQSLAQTQAKDAVRASEPQKPLVEAFIRDIWSQTSGAPMPAGHTRTAPDKMTPAEPYSGVHLYIFISESIPRATLKNYARDAEGLGAVFVLRGVLGDDPSQFMPTQLWVHSFLCDSTGEGDGCGSTPVDLNPTLYTLFDVRVVPTIVYAPDTIPADVSLTSKREEMKFLSWEGDAALSYVRERFQKEMPLDDIWVHGPVKPKIHQ